MAAVTGYTFGGGCEISMHCAARQAAPETYMGLVECGVGLIPAGGGCKEFTCRVSKNAGPADDLFPALNRVFECLGQAKASNSAAQAKLLGYMLPSDGISINKEHLLFDAKQRALLLAGEGYQAPRNRDNIRILGETGLAEIKVRLNIMKQSGMISAHDQYIGAKLASVLCGGELAKDSFVSEQYLLDLEREAFFELLASPKTQERIQHTLKTGKPLRN